MGIETKEFDSKAEFVRWMRMVVKGKWLAYDRVPVGEQTWTYGNGHKAVTTFGERGGTMLSNFGWMVTILDGKLEGHSTVRMTDDIDTYGGLTLTIDWGD